MKIEDIKQALENQDLKPIINSLTTDMLNLVVIDDKPLINHIIENDDDEGTMTLQALHLMNQEMLTIQNEYGRTPVHTAALHGHLDQIKDMLTPEMLTTPNERGWTAIHAATESGNHNQILEFLTPEMLKIKDNKNNTPIDNLKINTKNTNERDPIFNIITTEMLFEINNKHEPIKKIIIKNKIKNLNQIFDIEQIKQIKNQKHKIEIAKIAAKIGELHKIEEIIPTLENFPDIETLKAIIKNGEINVIKNKITKEMLKEDLGKGFTIMHYIAQKNQIQQLKEFITPDLIKLKTDLGVEVIQLMKIHERIILQKKIKTFKKTEQITKEIKEKKPITYAIIIKKLRTKKAGEILEHITPEILTKQDNNKNTPLHWVAQIKGYQQIKTLLTPEMFLIKNKNGDTPLHIAAKNGSIEQIEEYLNIENLFTQNKNGETAIDLIQPEDLKTKIKNKFLATIKIKKENLFESSNNITNLDIIIKTKQLEKFKDILTLNNVKQYINQIINNNQINAILHILNEEIVTQKDDDNSTIIHKTAKTGEINKILQFVNKNILEIKDSQERTPIIIALKNGNLHKLQPVLTKQILTEQLESIITQLTKYPISQKDRQILKLYLSKDQIKNKVNEDTIKLAIKNHNLKNFDGWINENYIEINAIKNVPNYKNTIQKTILRLEKTGQLKVILSNLPIEKREKYLAPLIYANLNQRYNNLINVKHIKNKKTITSISLAYVINKQVEEMTKKIEPEKIKDFLNQETGITALISKNNQLQYIKEHLTEEILLQEYKPNNFQVIDQIVKNNQLDMINPTIIANESFLKNLRQDKTKYACADYIEKTLTVLKTIKNKKEKEHKNTEIAVNKIYTDDDEVPF